MPHRRPQDRRAQPRPLHRRTRGHPRRGPGLQQGENREMPRQRRGQKRRRRRQVRLLHTGQRLGRRRHRTRPPRHRRTVPRPRPLARRRQEPGHRLRPRTRPHHRGHHEERHTGGPRQHPHPHGLARQQGRSTRLPLLPAEDGGRRGLSRHDGRVRPPLARPRRRLLQARPSAHRRPPFRRRPERPADLPAARTGQGRRQRQRGTDHLLQARLPARTGLRALEHRRSHPLRGRSHRDRAAETAGRHHRQPAAGSRGRHRGIQAAESTDAHGEKGQPRRHRHLRRSERIALPQRSHLLCRIHRPRGRRRQPRPANRHDGLGHDFLLQAAAARGRQLHHAARAAAGTGRTEPRRRARLQRLRRRHGLRTQRHLLLRPRHSRRQGPHV